MIKSRKISTTVIGVATIFLSAFALGGCGFKDKPVPPQQVLPRPVTDLRHQLSEKGVTLYWSYPVETVTGEDLDDISEFVMFRAVVPVDSYCETCPVPFGSPISLPGGALPDEGKKTASYQATLLRPGNLYFFKVRSKSGWWAESADSNTVRFLWNTPALAPEGLSVTAGDKSNALQWQPVKSHLDGTTLKEAVKYQVLRSLGGGPFQPVGDLLDGTEYVDTDVTNNRKYFYQVQTISIYPQGAVGGGVSNNVAATPLDKTPPAVPNDVRGIKTGAGLKIFWSPVEESDLKGYRVYRRLPGDDAPQLVGEVLLPYTMFIDREPPATAARIYYSVSSIDKRTPANESTSSPEVMIKN
ncbi:fibronectin type III domain-containing protein [Desulfogranum marinum]|uniref:fibronectin type III domain-containing protein n=1 Tax=Desulfogranum marinum TaxID=453220 RepID=UPI001963D32D|nr:fibronectin type III domain-containing protein [Desulfogranum marinum]MBM9514359.1 fibronectin type III domain-containing protein [Desulfogranum marinum]